MNDVKSIVTNGGVALARGIINGGPMGVIRNGATQFQQQTAPAVVEGAKSATYYAAHGETRNETTSKVNLEKFRERNGLSSN